MQVAVTGHQKRDGLDWPWVAERLRSELLQLPFVTSALSSLAVGSDQLFARTALSMGIRHVAVIPMPGYERFFSEEGIAEYRRLLALSDSVQLPGAGTDENSFFEAGKFVANHCDVLFAIWDGKSAQGLGGTADVVAHARERSKNIIQLNPITFDTIKIMGGANGS